MKLIKEPKFGISRRTLLAGAAIGATQIAAPFVITARAAEAIKIGLLLPKSGPYAVQGENGSERRTGSPSTISADMCWIARSRSSGSMNPARNRPSKTCGS